MKISQLNIALAAVLVLCLLSIPKIIINNDIWLDENDPIEVSKNFDRSTFDNDTSNLVISVNLQQGYFKEDLIKNLRTLISNIKNKYEYYSIESPLHSSIAISSNESLSIKSFNESLQDKTIANLAQYQKHINDSDYIGNLITKDYQRFLVNIKFQLPKNKISKTKSEIVKIVSDEIEKFSIFKDYKLSGKIYLDHKLNQNIKNDIKKLLAITAITIICVLFFIYRNFYKAFAATFPAIISAICAIHIINFHSDYFTALDIITIVSVIAIAISDGTHILSKWQLITSKLRSSATTKQLKHLFLISYKPCLITSISTAIGFGSFYFSEVIPLKNFAITAFFAIMVSYLNIMLFTTLIIFINRNNLNKKTAIKFNIIAANIDKIVLYSIRNKSLILSTLFIISTCCIFLYKNNYNESNFINIFFKKSSDTYIATQNLDNYFAGSGSINLILKSNQNDYFKEIKNFNNINNIGEEISKLQNVTLIRSYINPIAEIHPKLTNSKDRRSLPTKNDELEQELLFIEFSRNENQKEIISQYVDFQYSTARIAISTKNLNSVELSSLTQDIQEIVKNSTHNLKPLFAGQNIYFLKINDYLNSSFIKSILITIIAITILMAIFYQTRLALIAAVISLIPFLLILGLISALSIPYDYATIVIGATTFAIAIDNTIHLIDNYNKLATKNSQENVNLIKNNLKIMYYPLTLNMIVFSATFLVFCLSQIVLLNKFGFFSFLNIVFAYIINLVLTTVFLKNKS